MRILTASIAALVFAGCTENEPLDESAFEQEVQAANGTSLNGTSLNGTSLNGTSLNGTSLNGTSTSGATLGGTALTSVTITGSAVSAKKGATNLSGSGLIGSLFTGTATNGTTLTLRVDGVHALAAPNADVTAYVVKYQTTAGWSPLCSNAGNEVIPMSGTWNLTTGSHQADANKFTLACRDATFAKCVELGYKPWLSVAGVNLANHHEACTRALRADYCGDGSTYTVTGTTIDIFDSLNIQTDTQAWKIESNWTASGATCLGTPRYLASKAAGAVPACVSSRGLTVCSTSSWAGGLLIRTEANK